MTTIGTAQKSTKGSDLRPPREIVENTKARRAWLADALATVLAEPDTDRKKTKIVGTGSYQVVSVYKLITVEGRERFRGVCQFCGHLQVVDGDRIVLHGYNRPGVGYIVGKCPESHAQPLNTSDVQTRFWLAHFADRLPSAVTGEAMAEEARNIALAAVKSSGEIGWQSDNARPRLRSKSTPSERATFDAAMIEWTKLFPAHAASLSATTEWQKARDLRLWLADMVTHLKGLLAANILGSPLTREVVA